MARFSFKSIRTRLIFWFLLLSLIPLLTVIVITYFQRVNVIETRTFDKLTAIRDLKVERLRSWLSERNGDIYTISTDKELTELEHVIMKTASKSNEIKILQNNRRILNRYLKNYPVYSEIYIINPINGKIIVSTNVNLEGRDKSQDESFTKAMKSRELSIKDIYFSRSLSDYSMVYSNPIFCSGHSGKHIVGVLVAHINLNSSLYKMLLDRTGLGKTGETLIVNEDTKALNELRWYNNAPLNLQISAKPAVNAALGKTGILVTADYRGEDVLAAYTFIPETKWGFVCKQDLSELNAPIRELIRNFIFIFIVTSIIIAIIAISISRTISISIIEMDSVVQEIRAGNLSVRNRRISNDELGSLATEFNNMADMTESRIKIQQGISALSETMIGQSSMKEFGNEILKQLMVVTKANMSVFYILNETTSEYEHFLSIGANKNMLSSFSSENPEGELGNALSAKSIHYLRNIPDSTVFKFKTTAGEAIPKEIITMPVLIENTVVALISLVSLTTFSKECFDILQQSWTGINISYSSLLSNERTLILAESLARSNQLLEAQSEELQNQAKELQNGSAELQNRNFELEIQRKQVEEANRLKSEFLSNMSHELRTPLNSINALSQVLIVQAKNKLNEEENNYLEIVERNGKLLLSLINDILDLSKIEAGKMDLLPQPVLINSLLTVISENISALAEKKGISVDLNIPEKKLFAETDESKLHQVILNIVGNAVKFAEEGEVTISAKHNDSDIFIEVEDTGVGISEEMLPFIFDEFRQADGSSSRQYEGTGLGLAIAKKMIKVLGGRISVESKLGEGSLFTITVPVKWHDELKLFNSVNTEISNNETSNNIILIVDDDPKITRCISEYLTDVGFKTIISTSGKEALNLAERYIPFAITLDIIMPEMDGWEVLQKLKSNSRTKEIPVIIVSISDEKDTGFALGAVGYINKPINNNAIISAIKKLHKTPKVIMIIDDNDFELQKMAEIIETENMTTILAHNGAEGISLLENKIPDILVLDLLMPDLDGFQVLEKIRKNHKTINLPVIIVTAKDITKEDKIRLNGKVTSLIAKSNTTPADLCIEIKRILMNISNLQNNTSTSDDVSSHSRLEVVTVKEEIPEILLPRILIIEDNPDNMTTFKAILGNNYTISEAYDGEMGLDMVQVENPDLILLDMSLPKIDGKEVVRRLKDNDATKKIPVIAITARVMKGDKEKSLQAGCNDFISKPINPDDLTKKISKLLQDI